MPDTPKQPVTVGDLLTIGVDRIRRPATVADLVSALRAEGFQLWKIIHANKVTYDRRIYSADDGPLDELPDGIHLVILIEAEEPPKDPWDYDP